MPEMPHRARLVCQSAPWRFFARYVVLPWALQGQQLAGDVLEIGCGSGAMAAEILRRCPDVRMTATDFDDAMVDVARRRLRAFGDRASVRQADAAALPFDDQSFDFVVTFIMLHHVINWEAALAEIARVLRPGGALVGYDLVGDGTGQVINGHDHGTRRMQLHELREHLGRTPFATGDVRTGLAGRAARFVARKSSAND